MRYDKALYAPAEKYVFRRVELTDPKEGAALYHMKPTEFGLVAAEGSVREASLPSEGARLYALDRGTWAYLPAQKALYDLATGALIAGIASEPVALLPHATEAGVKGIYCVEQNATRYIAAGSVQGAWTVGGSCAAMHHGRLFVGSGLRLRFSAPFSAEGILQTERDPDKAGYIDFEEGKGDIVSLVSFRERLYVFFERGVCRMRAEGEAVDFAAAEMPFCGGKILSGSVAACGEKICFMTAEGLFSFDGDCDFLEKREEIDLSSSCSAYEFGGKYAAAVTLKSGENALYIYDLIRKSGRFLLLKGLRSGEGENFLTGTDVYRFTDSGAPLGYGSAAEVTLFTVPRALAWVRVEGEGEFSLETNAAPSVLSCKGGEKVRVDAKTPLSETKIKVSPRSASFRIRAVDVAWRKENGD